MQRPSRHRVSVPVVLAALALSGCFSTDGAPPLPGEEDGSSGAEDEDAPGEASDDAAPMTTGDAPGADAGEDAADTGEDPSEVPACGDGFVDDGEECDDGQDNGPGGACLADCTLDVCGNGSVGPQEACDDGDENALAIGACAPDCSTVIETRTIELSYSVASGNLGINPVAYLDGHCEPGSRAMFAMPGARVATTVPNQSVDAVDWVLEPFTAYIRPDGALVWITDETALLGVRDGVTVPLEVPIAEPCAGACLDLPPILTGMGQDWVSNLLLDCGDWSDVSTGQQASHGDAKSQDAFLSAGVVECNFGLQGARVYCVEQ